LSRFLRSRLLWLAVGSLASLVIGAVLGFWFMAPDYVARKVEQRLTASLARRGLTLVHHRIEWNHWTHLRVADLEVEGGPGLRLRLDHVDLLLSGHALLRGDARLVSAHAGTLEAELDLAYPLPTAPADAASEDGEHSTATADLALAHLKAHVRRGGAPVAAFDGEVVALERGAGAVTVRLKGDADYNGRQVAVEVDAEAEAGHQTVRVRPADASPVFRHEAQGAGWLEAREAVIQRDAGGVRAGVGAVRVQLEGPDGPVLTLDADQARAHRGPTGWVLGAEGGTLSLDPHDHKAILAAARALAESLRASLPHAPPPGADGPGAPTVALPTADALLGARLELRDLTLTTGATPVAAGVAVEAALGHIHAHGEVAGGTLDAEIDLTANYPTRVRLDFAGIDLQRLPPPLPTPPVGGRLSGALDFTGIPALAVLKGEAPAKNPLILKGNVRIQGGRFTHLALAPTPIEGLDLEAAGTLELDPAGEIRIPEGHLKSGPVVAQVKARIAGWPNDPVIDLDVRGTPTPCSGAVRQIPVAMLGPYQDVELSGTFAPTLKLHLAWKNPYSLKLETTGIADETACEVVALHTRPEGWPPVTVKGPRDEVEWLLKPFVLTVHEGVTPGTVVEVGPGTEGYVPLHDMPAWVGGAAYLSEEMGFYVGGGISLPLITKAIITNLDKKRFAYGGSTVTQQLVKNLFLTRDKTLARKLQEALVASRIAAVIPKDRTLELYLNCIEFGQNLYGIGRAAHLYFQKEASELTPLESVFLANIKPAPRNAPWYIKKGRSPDFPWWTDRTREILVRLADRGLIPYEEVERAAPYVITWSGGRYVPHQPPADAPEAPAPDAPAPDAPPTDEDAPDGVWQ